MPKEHRHEIEEFLRARGIGIERIWEEDNEQEEVEMGLTAKAKRDYKIERNPFLRDVASNEEMYENENFLSLKAALIDVAENGGFLLVTGDSGAGKTEHLLWLQERYRSKDNDGPVRISAVQMLDRGNITASHIYARILYDIEGEAKRQNAEVRHEQLVAALEKAHTEHRRVVCAVDDGQDLHPQTLRALRRFAGLRSKEDRARLLSVVIFAQPALRDMLTRRSDLREVTNRIDDIEIRGLVGDDSKTDAEDIEEYLRLKFEREGVLRKGQTFGGIFGKSAFSALAAVARCHIPQELHVAITKILNEASKIGGSQARVIDRDSVEAALRIKTDQEEEA